MPRTSPRLRKITIHLPREEADRIERLQAIAGLDAATPSASKLIGALIRRGLESVERELPQAA